MQKPFNSSYGFCNNRKLDGAKRKIEVNSWFLRRWRRRSQHRRRSETRVATGAPRIPLRYQHVGEATGAPSHHEAPAGGGGGVSVSAVRRWPLVSSVRAAPDRGIGHRRGRRRGRRRSRSRSRTQAAAAAPLPLRLTLQRPLHLLNGAHALATR